MFLSKKSIIQIYYYFNYMTQKVETTIDHLLNCNYATKRSTSR
jgi:hypothetical protein